ncbi:MAG: SHOCT domain-containing protein [Phycisphaerae bacterium]
MPPISLLAQHSLEHLTEKQQSEILYWGAGLILLVLAGGIVITFIRRHLKEPGGQDGQSGGFSLADLKRMRAEGHLTEEEYQAARAKLIAQVKQGDHPTLGQ